MNSAAEAVFFALACALTLLWLWRELPLQYVATVTIVAAAVGVLGCFVVKSSWWLPLIVLNSRGVSRFILRKQQQVPYYGWWAIALTCVLSTALTPRWSTPILALLMQLAT